uniref:Uncharacterized protein n=1 Tax=Oryzias latipes TaxID=8090 RepID=A0A3P9MQM9_ORYLA
KAAANIGMAQHVVLDKEKLICSICLDLQKDPVTIPCGHSYCLECIQNFWIGEEPKAHSCPQCRQSFTSRPVLVRNTILAELVEDARKAELQPTSSEQHVDCDFCEGKKLKAAMSCLTCMVSYCEQHLQPHFSVKTEAELDQLSSTEDHLHFLNNYSSLSDLSVCSDLPRFEQAQHCFDDVLKAVSEAREKLEETLRDQTTKILDIVDVFLPEDFRSREDFMKYHHQITLDPNTANKNLSLSEQNRTATWTKEEQNYSSHPDRYVVWYQVLSAEGLTGRCYWEVDWSGVVYIAVAYKDRSGTGTWDESAFGFNDKSWALKCSPTEYTFYHNSRCVSIAAPRSSRVGVYLNHKAGSLSFYSVYDSMTLLHKVQTTFTQPLHAGFWILSGMIRNLKPSKYIQVRST